MSRETGSERSMRWWQSTPRKAGFCGGMACGDTPTVFTVGSTQGSTPHMRGAWEDARCLVLASVIGKQAFLHDAKSSPLASAIHAMRTKPPAPRERGVPPCIEPRVITRGATTHAYKPTQSARRPPKGRAACGAVRVIGLYRSVQPRRGEEPWGGSESTPPPRGVDTRQRMLTNQPSFQISLGHMCQMRFPLSKSFRLR